MKGRFHMTDEIKSQILSYFYWGAVYPYRQKTKPPFQSRNFNLKSGSEKAGHSAFSKRNLQNAQGAEQADSQNPQGFQSS
jgi:hypothetical protein